MTKSILDKLKTREKFEKRILRDYRDILYKVFQVVYELDAELSWERIYRFSGESNFVMISGSALVPEGTKLSDGRVLDKGVTITASFTIPWCLLDDGSTAYQIADAAKDIKVFGELVGSKAFVDMIRNPEFTYDSLKMSLPDYEGMGQLPPETDNEVRIDMNELTQGQVRSMILDEEDDG